MTTNSIFHYFQMNSVRLRKYSRPPKRKLDDLGSSFSVLLSLFLLPTWFCKWGWWAIYRRKKKKLISTRWKHGKSNWRMIITCQCFFWCVYIMYCQAHMPYKPISVIFQPYCLWIYGLIFAPKVSIWLLGFFMIIELSSCSSNSYIFVLWKYPFTVSFKLKGRLSKS